MRTLCCCNKGRCSVLAIRGSTTCSTRIRLMETSGTPARCPLPKLPPSYSSTQFNVTCVVFHMDINDWIPFQFKPLCAFGIHVGNICAVSLRIRLGARNCSGLSKSTQAPEVHNSQHRAAAAPQLPLGSSTLNQHSKGTDLSKGP